MGTKKEEGGDEKALEMTEEEIDMFSDQPKTDERKDNAPISIPRAPPSSDGSDIIVSYGHSSEREGDTTPPVKSKLTHQPFASNGITTVDYSTFAEQERVEQKKKKKGRKSSKSVQKSLKSEEAPAKRLAGAGAILSGPQLGFKPQFRSNPLHNSVAPPTPPPTPATGFSSSATSEGEDVRI